MGVSPGEIGSTILLTRLERDCAPFTIRIPTRHKDVRETFSLQKEIAAGDPCFLVVNLSFYPFILIIQTNTFLKMAR